MKTLQIGLDWFPERAGGLPRYFQDFCTAAPAAGIGVRALVAGSTGIAHETGGVVSGFAARTAPLPSRLWGARRAIMRTLREDTPDCVASHFALYTLPALGLLGQSRGMPLVVHFHGPWALEGAVEGQRGALLRAKLAAERAVYARADALIVLSQPFADILVQHYGIDPTRISVVPGGIATGRFAVPASRTEARAALGWPSDRPILIAVRRLVPRMGLENLITAMADVVSRHPDALLVIGGRGPLADTLARRVADAGLAAHVRLAGFIADDALPLAWRAADLSVVPSTSLEGFGLIAAESLAAGTPALVTPVGGLPAVVEGCDPAMVCDGTSPAALAARINACLSGETVLPDAQTCRAFAAERYDWDVVTKRIAAIYAKVLR